MAILAGPLPFIHRCGILIRIALKATARVNNNIRAAELRVIDEEGQNLGVMKTTDALRMAQSQGVDLIEISPEANPPVAKLMSFGKYQYVENKKLKKSKATAKATELKTLQVKLQTGEHDLELKAKQASKFLKEGHRVKIDLYLSGRAKYLNKDFLKTRLERILHLITEEYKFVQEIKQGPKGFGVIIQRAHED